MVTLWKMNICGIKVEKYKDSILLAAVGMRYFLRLVCLPGGMERLKNYVDLTKMPSRGIAFI